MFVCLSDSSVAAGCETSLPFGSSSLLPMMTLPATKRAAPNHQVAGKTSEKMSALRTAVMRKLEDVFITLTRVVDVANVSARVNNPHMIALKRKLRPRNSCTHEISFNTQ